MRFLLNKLGLLSAMGSVLDLSGTYFIKIDLSRLSSNSDSEALYSDWEKIGLDFKKAENKIMVEDEQE